MKKILTIFSFSLLTIGITTAQSRLWGTCEFGGSKTWGTIYSADEPGTNFHKVYSFDSLNGAHPVGNLVLARNGKLYGVTLEGGYGDSCVIYSFDTITYEVKNVHDFFIHPQTGYGAFSGLTAANDGKLYGITNGGGIYDWGVIFSFDPSDNTYKDIHNFNDSTGASPSGKLLQSNNGKLYGMTPYGGKYNNGVLFSFNPIDSSYSDVYDFNLTTGGYPDGGLLEANDGKLYGVAPNGGNNIDTSISKYGYGVLFSFDPSNNIYTDLYNFDMIHGLGTPITLIQTSNNNLYGLASGGADSSGVLFSFDINTNTYTDVFDFPYRSGFYPGQSLTQLSNEKIIGTSLLGGANMNGYTFSFDITNNTFTKLMDFDSLIGEHPSGDILETGNIDYHCSCVLEAVMNIYPNPANTTITINQFGDFYNMHILNVLGQDIYNETITGFHSTLDVSNWSNGVYICKLSNNKTSIQGKFIIQKP